MKWWRAWRYRLTGEVVVLGGLYWRVTKQRGKIVGIEQWMVGTEGGTYGYTVWKGEIDPRGQLKDS